ncbi:MAG: WYL domain-containing protein [Bacteroidales bacterium]|nr:WYL domain-containing protein [Bacteroidales bacterium]
MAKNNLLHRLVLIVNKLSRPGCFVQPEELVQYVENRMHNCHSEHAGVSLRTLQRDFRTIEEVFGIVVKHKKGHGYYISEYGPGGEGYEELLLNFEILSSIDRDSVMQEFVLPEHRRPRIGVDFSVLFDAIREHRHLAFDYTYVRYGNSVSRKEVKPHYLKESQHRWYLVGYDVKDGRLKCFAVDRMSLPELLPKKFTRDTNIDIPALFRESYGIWNNPDDPVEDIVLRYDSLDGAFVKTLPLHESQQILSDDPETGLTISLRLRITNDFVMALLARSRSLEVLAPSHLRDRIRSIWTDALARCDDR